MSCYDGVADGTSRNWCAFMMWILNKDRLTPNECLRRMGVGDNKATEEYRKVKKKKVDRRRLPRIPDKEMEKIYVGWRNGKSYAELGREYGLGAETMRGRVLRYLDRQMGM